MLVCMAPIHILCFDHNNGQKTFKLKKVSFQGHRPADHDPNMWVICNLCKNDGLMKMTCLTIVQSEPVFPCFAMVEGGLPTAQIVRKQVIAILRFNTGFQDTKRPLIGHNKKDMDK